MVIQNLSVFNRNSIFIGIDLSDLIFEKIISLNTCTIVIISDDNLSITDKYKAFSEFLQFNFNKCENKVRLLKYFIPPGEQSKNRKIKSEIEDYLTHKGCAKDTILIALGGGVISDLVGFIASTYMRGIRFINIPTSFLSMVDSTIGGKTAVNTHYGKNLIGTLYRPEYVFIDILYLETLKMRHFINGMAEVIKSGAIGNKNLFEFLENFVGTFMKHKNSDTIDLKDIRNDIMTIIIASVKFKADIVTLDEKGDNIRNLLNFGHTIGHAIESILSPNILHGECISIGMIMEAELSKKLGFLHPFDFYKLTSLIKAFDLPTNLNDDFVLFYSKNKINDLNLKSITNKILIDKKNELKQIKCVIIKALGSLEDNVCETVSLSDLEAAISDSVMINPIKFEEIPKNIKLNLSGSKSIVNRSLVLAALSSGVTKLKNFLYCEDTFYMIKALLAFNAAKINFDDKNNLFVQGSSGVFNTPKNDIYLGNSGTTSRFLTTLSCLSRSDLDSLDYTILRGDSRMSERPIGDLVKALRLFGFQIDYLGFENSLPIKIKSNLSFLGGSIEVSYDTSTQFISSIMMCSPFALNGVELILIGDHKNSKAFIDLTVKMMKSFGVEVKELCENGKTKYTIPRGKYINPTEYEIESDATAASYPLAFAALTGTTCTINNLGSKSLQKDAKFAVNVLKPMGCMVTQSDFLTLVTGPPLGSLKPLGTINFLDMTDCFMTACVLASVAVNKNQTTTITEISNQNLKECNRIDCMILELSRFGIKCEKVTNGLKIYGIHYKNLKTPLISKGGINVHNDHRIAMSLSLLSILCKSKVLLTQKFAVNKTFPTWWSVLSQKFNVKLENYMNKNNFQVFSSEESVVFIGMRGAGKTAIGNFLELKFGYKFLDIDSLIEKKVGTTINNYVLKFGWESFREIESKMLSDVLENHRYMHFISCGGGVVEKISNLNLLKKYISSGTKVINLMRDINDIQSFLQSDTTRPYFNDNTFQVWERRKEDYYNFSNYLYYSTFYNDEKSFIKEKMIFFNYIKSIINFETVKIPDPGSYFLCIGFPDLTILKDFSDKIFLGCDAVEIRIDYLKDLSKTFIAKNVFYLRFLTLLPIIYTVRTVSQGGNFPDDNLKELYDLLCLGIKLRVEFLDIELSLPDSLIRNVLYENFFTKIIASYHDIHNNYKWTEKKWIKLYHLAVSYDVHIIKFVGSKSYLNDDLQLYDLLSKIDFKSMIIYNKSKNSICNRVSYNIMTPITHELFPNKTSNVQFSLKEITKFRSEIDDFYGRNKIYIVGSPLSQSKSYEIYTKAFNEINLKFSFFIYETTDENEVYEKIIKKEDFGGLVITMPLKIKMLKYVDFKCDDSNEINAINTIFPYKHDLSKLYGCNTDWIGVYNHLQKTGIRFGQNSDVSCLVIGSGGMARAVIYALIKIECVKIYVIGRNFENSVKLKTHFSQYENIEVISAVNFKNNCLPISIAISCIPHKIDHIDENLFSTLKLLFQHFSSLDSKKLFIDSNYLYQKKSKIEIFAENNGWLTSDGTDIFIEQAVVQFKLLTGYTGCYETFKNYIL